MPVDEPKAGPSGIQDKNAQGTRKLPSLPARKITPLRIRARTQLQQHVRRSSYEPLRYRLRARTEGVQKSHSVRRIVESQLRPTRVREKQTRYIVYEPEPLRRSLHHLEALEFYLRSSNYGRDSLQKDRQKSFAMSQRQEPSRSIAPFRIPKRYCKNCLEPIARCVCILSIERPDTSDWMVLLSHSTKRQQIFNTPRNEWLNKLESNTRINIDDVAKEKFNHDREICCFPFNTFKIFSKHEVNVVDYYQKSSKKK